MNIMDTGLRRYLYLTSLSLTHFRNYESARLEVDRRPVVLTGRNGAGKTNILEAISLLIPGRGLRRAKLSEMDSLTTHHSSLNTPSWVISAHIHGMQGVAQIGTGRATEEESDKRLVRIDGKPARSQAELARHLSILWLTPQMEQLFQEGASAGRKFLDRLVYGFDAEHASRVNEYEYAMRERNRLLSEDRGDAAWLSALEQTMAETAAAIACARLAAVENINHAILASDLSFPKAHIRAQGFVEEQITSGMAAIEAEEKFKKLLEEGRYKDAAAGRALVGTHKTELGATHLEKRMEASQCSTGEQKAVLLSIILAQARAAASWNGIIPVLLLDEVVSHLDSVRKLELFEEICQIGAQVWMTGTNADLFADLGENAQRFSVENNSVFPA